MNEAAVPEPAGFAQSVLSLDLVEDVRTGFCGKSTTDVIIIEQFDVSNKIPGTASTYGNSLPVRGLSLLPVTRRVGRSRYAALYVSSIQPFMHVVPYYAQPSGNTRPGGSNSTPDSEYSQWLLSPFDGAGSCAPMACLKQRRLPEVVAEDEY
ncbi:hypothetical protein H9P43_000336 [Blastocladiella emersonii ATCC 22665]|nr:hypothetical protein H9P43_000336 [Blastocladiella emersonii ATCC 22665]